MGSVSEIPSEYEKKLSDFVKEYIDMPAEGLNAEGLVPMCFAFACLGALIRQGVFTSEEDLIREAYKSYGILIPKEYLGFGNGG